ncbi:MAG: C4-dicarboxylate ABC transporter [Gammaproteobacteria bacterium]|nr:C4-dicarboxylate ABC transporter [Gammaproteobacteria bacterium]NIR82952.1 C4-dicarboxylate ABC transporter [Gammaproteobacteria bacterium]NIR90317.1 C4-dicarboxylate ABC transporter [Gammaproteobacteria bacterium]NIU04098.1 C4-dicarboxylate ABC transporter [Gammaproteobacteria bacterium]NIV51394.1 C4-dicarboxylate ABC transporter [Gammaproteobacteria bacterium]
MVSLIRLKLIALSIVGASFAFMAQTAQAEQWKFAIEEIQGSVQDAYAQELKKRIEQKTGGDVEVVIYPYGALGTSADLTELTTAGVLQLANASPGHLGTLVGEIQVFSIPYLLSQDNSVNKEVLTSSSCIYDKLAGDFESKGLKLLTMYPEGEMVWTTNKKITSPGDFSNFKMRVMVSPLLVKAYEAFGASPTPMPYGEVYGGLQLGQIDGQVNPIFAIEEMKFYEVTDYMIWAGQQQFTTTVVASNDWYNGLSSERRQMLDQTVSELADYIFRVQAQFNEERLEKIKKEKPELEMIHLNEQQRAAFKQRAQQVRDKYVDMVGGKGKEVLDCLSEEFGTASM